MALKPVAVTIGDQSHQPWPTMILPLLTFASLGASSEDPDLAAYKSRLASAGTQIYPPTYSLFQNFIAGLKADGLWNKIDELYVFVGVQSVNGTRVKLKCVAGGSTSLSVVSGSLETGDYIPYGLQAGLQMSEDMNYGGSKYLDTNLANSAITTGDHSTFAYVINGPFDKQFSPDYFWGDLSNKGCGLFGRFTDGNQYGWSGDPSVQNQVGAVAAVNGFYIITRQGDTDTRMYHDGTLVASNTAATTSSSRAFATPSATGKLYTNIASGTIDARRSRRRMTLVGVGKGLTPVECGNLSTRVATFMEGFKSFPVTDTLGVLDFTSQRLLAEVRTKFSTGEKTWQVAPFDPNNFGYSEIWAADLDIVLQGRSDFITSTDLGVVIQKFYAARDSNTPANIPVGIKHDGTAFVYSNGVTGTFSHQQMDGLTGLIAHHRRYYDMTSGDLTLFNAQKAVLKAAMLGIPRNGAYVYCDPSLNPFITWGYEDAVYKKGRDLWGTLLYYRAAKQLSELFGFAGDTSDSSSFATDASAIQTAVCGDTYLWHASEGMFHAADAQCDQIDIIGSAFAVWCGAASSTQASAISDYLNTNLSTITNSSGYILQSPSPWSNKHSGTFAGTGTGVNGFWNYGHLWVLTALAVNHPTAAVNLCKTFTQWLSNNGLVEWINRYSVGDPAVIGTQYSPYADQFTVCMGAYGWATANFRLFT